MKQLCVNKKGGASRLGIRAPRDVKILRKKTFDVVRLENLRAVQSAASYNEAIGKLLGSRSDSGSGDHDSNEK